MALIIGSSNALLAAEVQGISSNFVLFSEGQCHQLVGSGVGLLEALTIPKRNSDAIAKGVQQVVLSIPILISDAEAFDLTE